MNVPHVLVPAPAVFGFAALFAYGGWLYFSNTRKVCDMIAAKGWPRFLAKLYSGKLAYYSYKVAGIVALMVSLFLVGIGVLRLLQH